MSSFRLTGLWCHTNTKQWEGCPGLFGSSFPVPAISQEIVVSYNPSQAVRTKPILRYMSAVKFIAKGEELFPYMLRLEVVFAIS
jgi:hypothetical protein